MAGKPDFDTRLECSFRKDKKMRTEVDRRAASWEAYESLPESALRQRLNALQRCAKSGELLDAAHVRAATEDTMRLWAHSARVAHSLRSLGDRGASKRSDEKVAAQARVDIEG